MQCAGFLEKNLPKAQTETDFDTATAAQFISTREDCRIAAISSKHATAIYNLLALDENIEDDVHNMTRFLIFSREALDPATIKGAAMTTILFQTGHKPGALLSALKTFADNGVNLTKLETYMVNQDRPYPTFYVDVGAPLSRPSMKTAMAAFAEHTANFRVLGCYPASPLRGDRNSFLPVE
jgi:prephenate dehydratase